MYEIYNHLAKVQDTRKVAKSRKASDNHDMGKAFAQVNPDRNKLVYAFGGAFRRAA